MTAYYNEHDPFAAAWLRELIKAQAIAAGEVDNRDIRDVTPDDLRGFTQCHFFAGIGVWSYALRLAGWQDDWPVWTGSCPCQPFSSAGGRGGFDDERHLWPAWFHLIEQCRPRRIFGEQVASKDGLAWLDLVLSDLETARYTATAVDMCAAGVGAPHIRQRLWIVAADGTVADDHERGRAQLGSARLHADGQSGNDAARCSAARGLADGDSQRHEGSAARPGPDGRPSAAECGAPGGMGDAGLDGDWKYARKLSRDESEHGKRPADRDHAPEPAGAARELADADGRQLGRRSIEPGESAGTDGVGAPEPGRRGVSCGPGPVNGHWRAADWIGCRDGKFRPIEPGSFPLANGAPARVGRLRGFGNAIVAEAAAEFIRAALDCGVDLI